MCLQIDNDHFPLGVSPAIATADKHYFVWKVLLWNGRGWVTPYRRARMAFKRMHKANMLPEIAAEPVGREWIVTKGLHSYRDRCKAGITAGNWGCAMVFPALIPKGSKLYYGQRQDVVSNQLIVFKSMKERDAWAEKN